MPCSICHFNGHNKLTCPLLPKNQEEVAGTTATTPDPSSILELQKKFEVLSKEKESLRLYTDRLSDSLVRMTAQASRLENEVIAMKKANVLCDMELRKDLAGTLFDKKEGIPDGVYLELMNKLRI